MCSVFAFAVSACVNPVTSLCAWLWTAAAFALKSAECAVSLMLCSAIIASLISPPLSNPSISETTCLCPVSDFPDNAADSPVTSLCAWVCSISAFAPKSAACAELEVLCSAIIASLISLPDSRPSISETLWVWLAAAAPKLVSAAICVVAPVPPFDTGSVPVILSSVSECACPALALSESAVSSPVTSPCACV